MRYSVKYITFLILFLSSLRGLCIESFQGPIRIGLTALGNPKIFYLVPSSEYIEIFSKVDHRAIYTGQAKVVKTILEDDKLDIKIDGKTLAKTKAPVIFSAVGKPPVFLWIGSQKKLKNAFRGSIEISITGKSLFAVNIVSIKEYLRSVVPAEIGAKVPYHAFAAQAVAARSYALSNWERHKSAGYNLCDSQHCQVYSGIHKEQPSASKAVENTENQILIYNDKIANTVYHSNCGGKIHSSQEIWGGKGEDYLIAHLDTLGKGEPFCAWASKAAGEVKQISASVYTPVVNSPKNSSASEKSQSFRQTISMSFRFHPPRGHRVGMCQDGAIGMAMQGFTYQQILAFYYPNTKLEVANRKRIYDLMTNSSRSSKLAKIEFPANLKMPGNLPRLTFITKGKKEKDFRKWFWNTMSPQIYRFTRKSFARKEIVNKSEKRKRKKDLRKDKKVDSRAVS